MPLHISSVNQTLAPVSRSTFPSGSVQSVLLRNSSKQIQPYAVPASLPTVRSGMPRPVHYSSQPLSNVGSSQKMQPHPVTTLQPVVRSLQQRSTVPASAPSGNMVAERAQRCSDFSQRQLRMSALLDTFMRRTKGKCGRCFVTSGRLLEHKAFSGCPDDGYSIPPNWVTSVKNLFSFDKFTFCWNCGAPQDRRGNKESPDCHRAFQFKKGTICPWADFMYVAIWTL